MHNFHFIVRNPVGICNCDYLILTMHDCGIQDENQEFRNVRLNLQGLRLRLRHLNIVSQNHLEIKTKTKTSYYELLNNYLL